MNIKLHNGCCFDVLPTIESGTQQAAMIECHYLENNEVSNAGN